MKAENIMTRNPECVTPDEPIARAAEIMRDVNVGIVPVVSDRNSMRLTGVITDRDIAIRHVAERHRDECTVRDHMSTGAIAQVRPQDDVAAVTDAMKRASVRRIPVVEDGDRLVGIVAQADIADEMGVKSPRKVADTVRSISQPAEPRR